MTKGGVQFLHFSCVSRRNRRSISRLRSPYVRIEEEDAVVSFFFFFFEIEVILRGNVVGNCMKERVIF